MRSFITVKLSVRGFHRWAGAPAEVSFLASRHRHLFGIEVSLYTSHEDRQVEFFIFQRWLESALQCLFTQDMNGEYDFGERSCEMIARMIAGNCADSDYSVRSVVVSEDGENSGGVEV
jgi:hypothetical protein